MSASDGALKQAFGGSFWVIPPSHLGVAVSGGSDSMALLELAREWAAERDVKLSAVTVDHGLRAASKDEAEFVARHCEKLKIPHSIVAWDGWNGSGNLQAEARQARYRLLADWARDRAVDAVVVGHTADDQAETFMMRLGRRSGVDGLAAMQARFRRNGIHFFRPLLDITRSELRDYLRRHDVGWIDDPSNDDMRFERVKARAALSHLEPLGVSARTLRGTTHNLSMAASALRHYTLKESKTYVTEDRGDLILTGGPELPVEIERRLTIGALRYIGGDPYPPRTAALGEMNYGLLTSGTHTLAGCLITQEGDARRFTRELNAVAGISAHPETFWDRRWKLEGPQEPGLEVRALGAEGLPLCPDWRDIGLPRSSLLASPAIWRQDTLIAAPVAGLTQGWSARPTRFAAFLLADTADL